MKTSSLNGKTIRPGLLNYSFYASDRHPVSRRNEKSKATANPKPIRNYFGTLLSLAVAVLIVGGTFTAIRAYGNRHTSTGSSSPAQAAATADGPKECSGNSLDKLIVVSVSERHLWACMRHKVAYDSPVITGMKAYAATVTPVGTYHIYSKQTDTVLTGSDESGSWRDPVSYWMPFLDNQYGTYGFHDATWRADNAFGNVSPDSKDASHGCVELPLSTSKWLYQWAPVGTTVIVKT